MCFPLYGLSSFGVRLATTERVEFKRTVRIVKWRSLYSSRLGIAQSSDLRFMRRQYFWICVLATTALLLLVPTVEGQGNTLITLDQAVDLALAHNHALKATRTLILQNQAQEITANLRPNPTFDFDSQFLPIFSPSDFSSDNLSSVQQFDIGIGYLFERGHKRQRRLQAAQDQTAVTRAQVTDAERTLAFNVGQQFISVLLAESTLVLPWRTPKSFQQTVDIGEAQYKAGYISEADYLKITLQLLQFQTRRVLGSFGKSASSVGLRELLGYDAVPADYDVIGDLSYQPYQGKLEDLQVKAIQERPDYRASDWGQPRHKARSCWRRQMENRMWTPLLITPTPRTRTAPHFL